MEKCFYSDFILVPFAIIAIFSDTTTAFQILIITMTILCGIFTYMTVNKISGSAFTATISAILYTFCLYRLLDVYHRFAFGEAISFTFIPIVFWGLYHIVKGDYKKWYIISIGFSLLVFTHVLSTFLTFATILLILIINYKSLRKEPKRLMYLILAGCTTVLVTSYYLFPMFEQMLSNTFYYKTNETIFPRYFRLDNFQVIDALFGGFTYPKFDFAPPRIGAILGFGILIRLFVWKKSAEIKIADMGVLIGVFYLFVSSSYFPWEKFPFYEFSFIQFPPWRLFVFVSFFFAIGIGVYLAAIIKSPPSRSLAAVFITVIITTALMYTDGKLYRQEVLRNNFERIQKPIPKVAQAKREKKPWDIYTYFRMGNLEYVPSKVPSPDYIKQRKDSVIPLHEPTTIDNFERNKGVTSVNVKIDEPDTLELPPLLYYKGYTAALNEKNISISESDNGLVEIPVNESGNIKVYYAGTTVQRVSWYISLISILIFVSYILYSRKRKNEIHQKDTAPSGRK